MPKSGAADDGVLIRGGRLIDPAADRDEAADLLLRDGRVAAVGPRAGAAAGDDAGVIDADGLAVIPGLIDVHTHLRDPGGTHKEDIGSGTRAAARGGFTAVACMPNTDPVVDDVVTLTYGQERSREAGVVDVYPIGALTRAQEGRELADIGAMAAQGVFALSDDGEPVVDGGLMLEALKYAAHFDLPVISHAEDPSVSGDGVMHEGRISARLGLPGIPAVGETTAVFRDVALAEAAGSRLHVAHVTTAGAVDVLRQARERGAPVTAEVCPHHLLLTDATVADTEYDPDTKVNPPLRSEAHREALLEGLLDGTLDLIATDHAPHHRREKGLDYAQAPFGISGLETAFPLMYTYLVADGPLSLIDLVGLMSMRPADIFDLPGGRLTPGSPADVALVDLAHEGTVDPADFASRGKNTPFDGWPVAAGIAATFKDGRPVHDAHLPAAAVDRRLTTEVSS